MYPPPPPPRPPPPLGPLSEALSTRIVRPSNLESSVRQGDHKAQTARRKKAKAANKRRPRRTGKKTIGGEEISYSTLFIASMAFWASDSCVYRTNPNPRLRPVSRSLTTTFSGHESNVSCVRQRSSWVSPDRLCGARHGLRAKRQTKPRKGRAGTASRSGNGETAWDLQLPRRRRTPQTSGAACPPQCAMLGRCYSRG